MTLEEYRRYFATSESRRRQFEYVRWCVRFDTITGPAIGGAIMVGTLLLAALAAYFGG